MPNCRCRRPWRSRRTVRDGERLLPDVFKDTGGFKVKVRNFENVSNISITPIDVTLRAYFADTNSDESSRTDAFGHFLVGGCYLLRHVDEMSIASKTFGRDTATAAAGAFASRDTAVPPSNRSQQTRTSGLRESVSIASGNRNR